MLALHAGQSKNIVSEKKFHKNILPQVGILSDVLAIL